MAFKFELSKTQVSSAFTPIDEKLFKRRFIDFRFVFLFRACEMSIAKSSFTVLTKGQTFYGWITLKILVNFDRPQ